MVGTALTIAPFRLGKSPFLTEPFAPVSAIGTFGHGCNIHTGSMQDHYLFEVAPRLRAILLHKRPAYF